MKKLGKIGMMALFCLCTFNQMIASSIFASGNNLTMNEMVKQAGEEGKLILIDFYADWCTPCKWMDETVFSDHEIKNAIQSNYLAKKINIDDIEGFDLKKQYKVSVLPTILILNTKGQVVERIEKTMNVSELLDILNIHNQYRNKVKIKHDINSSPSADEDPLSDKNIRDSYLRYLESNENTKRNYRLQLGIYTDYKSAFAKVNSLKKTFLEPIIVVNDYVEDKVRFKVMMGEFPTMEEADGFRKILAKDFSLDAIIN